MTIHGLHGPLGLYSKSQCPVTLHQHLQCIHNDPRIRNAILFVYLRYVPQIRYAKASLPNKLHFFISKLY